MRKKGDFMLIIVKDDVLTEGKKQEYSKYSGLFRVMNKVSHLIEELQAIGKYLSLSDEEKIRNDAVEKMEDIIDKIEHDIDYARKYAKRNKAIWEGGDLGYIIDLEKLENYKKRRLF